MEKTPDTGYNWRFSTNILLYISAISPVFGALVGGDPLKFREDIWCQETRITELS